MPLFELPNEFELENGERLINSVLHYEVLGNPSNEPVWICHALTGSATVKDWWPTLFKEHGGFLDLEKHYIICANSLGSCYGSTNPESYEGDFPEITHRDVVAAFHLLKEHLSIDKIDTLIGGSLGGQQALEWSIIYPDEIQNLAVVGSNVRHSAWGIAWNHIQRLAIDNSQDDKGLALAREIAMLSYRSAADFDEKENHWNESSSSNVISYLNHQGDKFINRFNKQAYYLLTELMDKHDVGRGRSADLTKVLRCIKANSLIIGINSDVLFPIKEQEFLAAHIPHAQLEIINSTKGHDAFLLEGNLISKFITNHSKKEFICN